MVMVYLFGLTVGNIKEIGWMENNMEMAPIPEATIKLDKDSGKMVEE